MRIVAIVGGIFLILVALACGYRSHYFYSLPYEIEKSYSLEWLPSEGPRDISRFQIDTGKGVIKYFYLDEQTSKPASLTHPMRVNKVSCYKVNQISVVDSYLVTSLVMSGWTIFGVIALAGIAVVLGIIGIVALIDGIRDEV